jgi:hypothetical protein
MMAMWGGRPETPVMTHSDHGSQCESDKRATNSHQNNKKSFIQSLPTSLDVTHRSLYGDRSVMLFAAK